MKTVFKRRLLKLADIIERGTLKGVAFNMSQWAEPRTNRYDGTDSSNYYTLRKGPRMAPHTCDTVACIGGTGELAFRQGLTRTGKAIGEYLGLGDDLQNNLFYPSTLGDWDSITPRKAAKVIRNLVRTGSVDWSV